MRISREVSKERLTEAINEVMDDLTDSNFDFLSPDEIAEAVADGVWQLLGELDDEDDLGILKLKEESPEDGG